MECNVYLGEGERNGADTTESHLPDEGLQLLSDHWQVNLFVLILLLRSKMLNHHILSL